MEIGMKYHVQMSLLWMVILVLTTTAATASSDEEPVASKDNYQSQTVEGMRVVFWGSPSDNPDETKVLVFLHGDSGRPERMFPLASEFGSHGVISIVMARPGCAITPGGPRSEGKHNTKNGSHLSKNNIEKVGQAIQAIKDMYGAENVYAVGHSGGAAISGVLIGTNKELLKGVVLAACPTYVSQWRLKIGKRSWGQAKSPHSYIADIPKDTKITLLAGDMDTNTGPWLMERYAKAAREEGLVVDTVVVKGAKHHQVRDNPEIRIEIDRMLAL